ncbi:hypothetical protein AOLI_G00115880 [Acnodon oligacanthus]
MKGQSGHTGAGGTLWKPRVTGTAGNGSNFVGEFCKLQLTSNQTTTFRLSSKNKSRAAEQQNASRQFPGPVRLPSSFLSRRSYLRFMV